MGLRRWLTTGFAVRRGLRTLSAIEQRLAEQNLLLARLANHFAPMPPAVTAADVVTHSQVDHLDEAEMAIVLDFVARTERDTGHTPDEDEIATYLADEKTVDLHQRLIARDREIEERRLRRTEEAG